MTGDQRRIVDALSAAPALRSAWRWLVLTGLVASVSAADQPAPVTAPDQPASELPQDPLADFGLSTVEPTPLAAEPPLVDVDGGEQDGKKKGELAVTPIPSYNSVQGFGLNLMAIYVFPPDDKKDGSRPTNLVGAAFGTTNGSWGGFAGVQMFPDRDRWRVLVAGGYAAVNYDFYGVGTDAGDLNKSIGVHQEILGGRFEVLRRVIEHFYAGPYFDVLRTRIRLENPPALPPGVDPALLDRYTSENTLGAHLQWDSRSSQFYPRTGYLSDFRALFADENFGSDKTYQIYQLAVNGYHSLSERQVLAWRVTGRDAEGNVPFYRLSQLGAGADLRGYTPGRFRDAVMVAGQAEWRVELPKSFGAVAFAGLGAVGPAFDDISRHDLMPSAGIGLRYTLSMPSHINLRIDYAWGRDDQGLYIAVGEAF